MGSTRELNPRIAAIPPSATLRITSKAKAMAASGREIFSFAAGEPDFDTPEHIKAAAREALDGGETKYSPAAGLADLRTAIAEKLKQDNGLSYESSQVVVSNGAKHSLFNVIMALCHEGDEVIIPAPCWLSYPEMVRVAGAEPVLAGCAEDNDFKIRPDELENAISERTKAVIMNSPSNPIGVVYSPDELRALADVAVRNNVTIISDEIYEKILYDGATHASPAAFSDAAYTLTVTINGFSKAYSMTGWRLGYAAGPAEVMKAVSGLQSHSASGPNTFAQYGGLAALRGSQGCVDEMVEAFAKRRAYLYERLTSIEGVTCVKPMGAFYMLPNISKFGLDSLSFAERLLEEHGVAVVPGAPFGADANVRLSYACSMDNIREGLDRFESFVQTL